jgi:hypothetical protein
MTDVGGAVSAFCELSPADEAFGFRGWSAGTTAAATALTVGRTEPSARF